MKRNTKTLQIKFNLDDPFQKKIYDYVLNQTSNVSNYGRGVFYKEMMEQWAPKEKLYEMIDEDESLNEDLNTFI